MINPMPTSIINITINQNCISDIVHIYISYLYPYPYKIQNNQTIHKRILIVFKNNLNRKILILSKSTEIINMKIQKRNNLTTYIR